MSNLTANLTAAQSLVWENMDQYPDPITSLDELYDILENLFVLPGETPGIGGNELMVEEGDELDEAYVTVLTEARARHQQ